MTRMTLIAPDKVNGHERTRNGLYVPTRESLKKVLDSKIIPPEPAINYVPQGSEVESLEVYRKIGKSTLLVGPTGIGKSMLVRAMAQRWGMPFLYTTCDPDKTEGKLMGRTDIFFGTVISEDPSEKTEASIAHFQQFRPSNISIAGLSGEPVVLFIDELHKLRRDMDVIFHAIVNEREVNLSDHLGPGEVHRLHDGTVIVFALNPYYDGGIDKVGPAMRQRLATIEFEMLTETKRLLAIVNANLGGMGGKNDIAKTICDMCASLCRVFLAHHKRSTISAASSDATIKNTLGRVMLNINEAPSPRLVVDTMKAIMAGLAPAAAVREVIFNSITNDFGETVTALNTIASSVYGITR